MKKDEESDLDETLEEVHSTQSKSIFKSLMSAEELYRSGKMPDMMTHWYSIRKQYPEDFLLAYRMGDFYEFFYDDAVRVAKFLGLTLTKRGSGPSTHPLAGIPHKATQHFKTLVKQGQTVIIVEQLEDPKTATGKIVKRGVVRVLTPGTVIDDSLLDSTKANYVCGITRKKQNYGVAFLDISSGEFYISEFFGKNALRTLWSYISRYSPVEAVLPPDLLNDYRFMSELRENTDMIIKEHANYHFLYQNAYDLMLKQFSVENLHSFDVEDTEMAICAAGGVLSFIHETQKETNLKNVTSVKYIRESEYMFLDINTQKNLEILRNQNDGGIYGTLFSVLDDAKTPMGTRLMKNWLVQPLLSKEAIDMRLDQVSYFYQNYDLRFELRNLLGHMGDLMRLATRVNYSNTANARDLLSIKNSLEIIREVITIFSSLDNSSALFPLAQKLTDFSDLIDLLNRAVADNPPTTITEGGIIKTGYNQEIDEYRDILSNGKNWILKFENDEKSRVGINAGLKIAYNRVLGYYIQITQNALKDVDVPSDYQQRQTLKNAVRYETPRLKEMETKILSAEENVFDLEHALFQELRQTVQGYTERIQKNAEIIAQLDVLASFAETAQNYNFCRPVINQNSRLVIKKGRHPVVELLNTKEQFVPNDCLMDNNSEQVLIITGPNWSGKSTYLRQVALAVLMAQTGCFIPAESGEIGIVDRIFTRIGASDDLARGQSTFMLEMNEMAQILNYSTEKSLIIIDELGRGTGTLDGQSIAQAVLEHLHDSGVKTLFSTHFHQLIYLKLPRVHNYHFKIIEKPETRKLIFLRQLTDGGTNRSYGIHVAQMAGIPDRVIERAFDLMESMLSDSTSDQQPMAQETTISTEKSVEKSSFLNTPPIQSKSIKKSKSKSKNNLVQTSLFPIKRYDDSELVILLRSLDLDALTPLEAFDFLRKMKTKIL